jgi:hypothetical protein
LKGRILGELWDVIVSAVIVLSGARAMRMLMGSSSRGHETASGATYLLIELARF